MKTRRKLSPALNSSLKQKQIIVYAAVGIAISIIVGVGLFFYFNVGPSFDTFAKKNGDGYISSGTGAWLDAATWEKSQTWMSDTPGEDVNIAYVDLNGYITRYGNLTLGGSTVLTVYDTLRVTGDLYVGQGSTIIVESGGVLIVEQDYITDGGADNKNDAIVIVMGDLVASGGADLINNDRFYLFGTPTSSGGATFNGDKNNPSSGNFLSEQDLINANPGLYAFATGNTTLPITLLSFEVNAIDDVVEIIWKTAEEINNDFFTIERSADGKQFEIVETIEGAGNSQNELTYTYLDENPISGQSFYRLKQTDYDGQFEYFDIVTVHVDEKQLNNQAKLEVLSYGPNPFQASFSAEFNSIESGDIEMRLTDMNGVVVAHQKMYANAGNNKIEFQGAQNLKSGTYLMQMVHPKYQSKPIKLVKR